MTNQDRINDFIAHVDAGEAHIPEQALFKICRAAKRQASLDRKRARRDSLLRDRAFKAALRAVGELTT